MSGLRGGPKPGGLGAGGPSGSGAARVVGPTPPGIRRLHDGTPPKNNTSANNNGSSTSPVVVNGCELFPGVPNISHLNSEQKLEFIQRLMRNEYVPGGGWDQFFAKKEHPVKNLRAAFDSDALLGCSEIQGHEGSRLVETVVLDEATEEEDDEEENDTLVEKAAEESQPEFCKMLDELMKVHDDYKMLFERALEAVVEKNFAEAFPDRKVMQLINGIAEFMKVLDAFNNESPAANVKLFFPSDSSASPKKTVNCPVEQQEEFVECLYGISRIVAKLDKHMKGDKWKHMETVVADKMKLYKKTVDKMDRDLKDLQKRKKSISEGYSLLSTFANFNTSGSSGGS